jgi:protein involved in polysaccharide export with SLBB domain
MLIVSRVPAPLFLCLAVLLQACTPPPGARAIPVRPQQQAPAAAPAPVPARQVTPQATPQPRAVVQPPPRPTSTDPLDANVYRLSSGDVVRIDVLGEAELSLDAAVDTSGYIGYPFLGQVLARGLTVGMLQQQIRGGLAAGYLVKPDVRVTLKQYRPIFVGGEVRQAGAYPYSLGLTVEQALTLAGGMSTYGSASRVFLQKWGDPGADRIRVDMDDRVYPGDTIVVEERFF